MDKNDSKKTETYTHKSTPIPVRTRQFCHSSSSNSYLHDDSKPLKFGSSCTKENKKSSTLTPNVNNSVQTFDNRKHSLCTHRLHEFNFPKVSTPFSSQIRHKDAFVCDLKSSSNKPESPLYKTNSQTANKHISDKNESPIIPRKHFTSLLDMSSQKTVKFVTNIKENAELDTKTVSYKTSPFKTPSSSSFTKIENQNESVASNLDGNISNSWQQRSSLAIMRHYYRNIKQKETSLDSNIGNIFRCRFEPKKATPPMLKKATNFLNATKCPIPSVTSFDSNTESDMTNNGMISPKKKRLKNVLNNEYMISENKNTSVSDITYNRHSNQAHTRKRMDTFSGKSPITKDCSDRKENHQLCKNPIDNVNTFFTEVQYEANQSTIPSVRDELLSKLLNEETLSQSSYNSPSCYVKNQSLNRNNINVLFDVIKSNLLSFELALKFIVGLSSNFYNCYNDISNAGDESILAIEDDMMNNVKLMDVIPDDLISKFLKFGEYCSKSISTCEKTNSLSVASIRNISTYFSKEIDGNPIFINRNEQYSGLINKQNPYCYSSNIVSSMSPVNKPIKENTSTPNHSTGTTFKRSSLVNNENMQLTTNYLETDLKISVRNRDSLKSPYKNMKMDVNRRSLNPMKKKFKEFLPAKLPIPNSGINLTKRKLSKNHLDTDSYKDHVSEGGYQFKSPRRQASRRSPSLSQGLSVMSANDLENVALEGNDNAIKETISTVDCMHNIFEKNQNDSLKGRMSYLDSPLTTTPEQDIATNSHDNVSLSHPSLIGANNSDINSKSSTVVTKNVVGSGNRRSARIKLTSNLPKNSDRKTLRNVVPNRKSTKEKQPTTVTKKNITKTPKHPKTQKKGSKRQKTRPSLKISGKSTSNPSSLPDGNSSFEKGVSKTKKGVKQIPDLHITGKRITTRSDQLITNASKSTVKKIGKTSLARSTVTKGEKQTRRSKRTRL